MAGKTLGHYVLEAEAGMGGLGEVYRAYDSRLHRAVAVKMLHEDLREGTGWEQILVEARAASALNHPNICTIYEVGEADGHAYMAMEFVDGKPLGQIIPSEGLAVETAIRYAAQIADALAHGHEKGVCHGDLTSCNVMVDQDDRIKILDFGLAQRFAVPTSPMPGGEFVGRVGRGRPAVLGDIQRFGAVLYEMATGMLLGSRESVSPNLSRIAPALRVPIHRSLNAGTTGGYEEIAEARDDLRASLSPAAAPSLDTSRASAGNQGPAGKLSRRARWVLAACMAVALCILTVGLLHWHRVRAAGVAQGQELSRAANPGATSALSGGPNIRVWANTRTRVYHCPETRWYGKTKSGEFMAQAEAERQGYKPEAGRVCEK
ncbi:MAG: serine/threonine-protein kinase [Terriglobia bacterium]